MKKLNFGRIGYFVGSVIFWGLAIWLLVVLSGRVRQTLNDTPISSIKVNVVDSTQMSNLVTTQMVMQMLKGEKIVGLPKSQVDFTKIEQKVASNGFVASVDIYSNYGGEMFVDVSQREAVARIMIDGYNSYIDKSGYIFSAPTSTALYAPVVTGKFRLAVPRGFVGSVDDYMLEQMSQIEKRIEQIEFERHPILMRERDNSDDRHELRRQYTSQRLFESRESYVERFTALRISNQRKRELYAFRQRLIDSELDAIDRRIKEQREAQLKVMMRCDDIHNLITLVEMLETDRFWRNEVVQLVVSEGDRGEMRVSMEVRSGGFSVTVGEIFDRHGLVSRSDESAMELLQEQRQRVVDRSLYSSSSDKRLIAQYRATERRLVRRSVEAKLDRVRSFYDEALKRVGWDIYSDINVEFENQIVCKR